MTPHPAAPPRDPAAPGTLYYEDTPGSRCRANSAPINETLWLRNGRVVDTDGICYDAWNGQPISCPTTVFPRHTPDLVLL